MGKYQYKISFEEAIKQGIPKEEYARESSKNYILTWIANELAEANRLKRLQLKQKQSNILTSIKGIERRCVIYDKDLEDQA